MERSVRKTILAGAALVAFATPSLADYTPTQRLIIALENWRVRAKECRSIYNSFTGPEITALTDFIIHGTQLAKFDATELSDLMKAIEINAGTEPKPTKELCERLRSIVFGAP
jgi:hypothetical protein